MKPKCPHADNLALAVRLSRKQIPGSISPIAVAKLLNREKLSFVLIGSYGISGWIRKPRATQDIDLVMGRFHRKKAVIGLVAAFPHLRPAEDEFFLRLQSCKFPSVAIDLVRTHEPLYKMVFKFATPVSIARQRFRIPTLELALALKFSALTSPKRDYAAVCQDAHDFIRMARINPDVDLNTLARLGDLACDHGGERIVEKVRGIHAGERFRLD